MSDENRTHLERDETDASLRLEREKADDAIGQPTTIETTADAVIEKARERADLLLASARKSSDRRLPRDASGDRPRALLERERLEEDNALRDERGAADEVLRIERAEHAAVIEVEREETDKSLSRERARADVAVSTRDEFLGIVSHDLRNMLTVVVGFGALIKQAELGENHRDRVLGYAERIRRSGARMNRLIGDLVDLASIEAGSLAVTKEAGDPAHVVLEAVDTFRAEAAAMGIELTAETTPGTHSASFDSARLFQVLVNLLTNAIKFTPRDGKVAASIERVGDDLRFVVRDTGVGIPADKLDAVFERYRQVALNDRRGVGLGLYISKCIVLGHGGKIWVESRLGEGSTFCFTIPTLRP